MKLGSSKQLHGVCVKAVCFHQTASICMEKTSWENWGVNVGIKVGGYNINNFRYEDDIILVSNSRDKLQHLLNIIVNETKRKASINIKKTEHMIISKKNTTTTGKTYIYDKRIRQVEALIT